MGLRTWRTLFGLDPPLPPEPLETEPYEKEPRRKEPGEARGPDLLRWFRRRRYRRRPRHGP